jgi:hypothetical protein
VKHALAGERLRAAADLLHERSADDALVVREVLVGYGDGLKHQAEGRETDSAAARYRVMSSAL